MKGQVHNEDEDDDDNGSDSQEAAATIIASPLEEVLALPVYPGLSRQMQEVVVEKIAEFYLA